MIIERIAGRETEIEAGERAVELVHMRSDDLVKRIQRVVSDRGTALGIRLSEPKDLCDGDVLYEDAERVVVVRVLPDKLIVIRPASLGQMGYIAHQIGNRHTPAQFEGDAMLVQYDALLTELLEQHDVPYSIETRAVRKAFRHIGHSHDHAPGPTHSHSHGHVHNHDHEHSHDHLHSHDHSHSHDQTHNHDHAHSHDPSHSHEHSHELGRAKTGS